MIETSQNGSERTLNVAQRIVAILVNEDSETRRRAIQVAMILLGDELPASSTFRQQSEAPDLTGEDDADLAKFFTHDEKLKPSDHVQLCAAYHFSIFGTAAFSVDELRSIASNAGVVLPDRVDKTLNSATKNGRKLFQVSGKGAFKPTVSAGLVFKERWNVKPGKRAKNAAISQE
jgi:hypothetical protein